MNYCHTLLSKFRTGMNPRLKLGYEDRGRVWLLNGTEKLNSLMHTFTAYMMRYRIMLSIELRALFSDHVTYRNCLDVSYLAHASH